MDNQELLHTQDTTTTVCRCDEVAYYVVQECRHRGFILGWPLRLSRALHRASETPGLDVVTQTSQRAGLNSRQSWVASGASTYLIVVMTGVGERRCGETYNY